MEQFHSPERRPAHRAMIDPEIQVLIEAGIEVARQSRRDIDLATARMIAHALAAAPDSALARFADSGAGSNTEARAEYLPLYLDEGTPDDVHALIDWLGAYLIHQENPRPQRVDRFWPEPQLGSILWLSPRTLDGREVDLYIPGDLEADDEQAMLIRLPALIESRGQPFLYFLEMNDVNAADENIGESFDECYVGTFVSRDETLRAMAELDDIEEAIRDIAIKFAGGEFVRIDKAALLDRISDVWDIVEDDGQYHVFNK